MVAKMNSCLICNKPRGKNKLCCSRSCYSTYRSNVKKCVICGAEFYDAKSNMTVTCSKVCSRLHRQQMHADGKYTGTLDKAHEIAKTHPLTGRFDTHMHAKTWIIQSPTGEIYNCRNLKNWLRDHADLIDGTVSQAWDGISKIKYTMQGKRKNKSHQWKGWRLLEYGEK